MSGFPGGSPRALRSRAPARAADRAASPPGSRVRGREETGAIASYIGAAAPRVAPTSGQPWPRRPRLLRPAHHFGTVSAGSRARPLFALSSVVIRRLAGCLGFLADAAAYGFLETCLELMADKPNPDAMADESGRLFSFGVIADIQYADLEDGYNYQRSRRRYYRHSLLHLQGAIEAWNKESTMPCCILQLGDIIDGYNAQYKVSEESLELVMNTFKMLKVPVHHTWGNHEFYNFTRDFLTNSKLNTKFLADRILHHPETTPSENYYAYHFVPFPKFRFILLDAYDLSVLGIDQSSPKYGQCMKMLREHNPNMELNSPQGLSEPQYVQFNGGFSQEQLNWLNEVLMFSDTNQEKVVIVSHLPIYPAASDSVCLAWNYTDALAVIWSHKCVVCFLAGHTHDGGYSEDPFGVHHVNLEGVIETAPDSQAFGTVHVYPDKMMLKGRGRVPDRIMKYKKEQVSHL